MYVAMRLFLLRFLRRCCCGLQLRVLCLPQMSSDLGLEPSKAKLQPSFSSVLRSLAGSCAGPRLACKRTTEAAISVFETRLCISHKICIRFVAVDAIQVKCIGCTLRRPSLQSREHAKRRDYSALEHACTDAAAASHGRLHKSPPAFIDSHVAHDGTAKDLRAHEGGDTGRRLLRLQAAGLDVVERRQ